MYSQIQDYCLKEIAGKKLHHENGMYINPFADHDRHGLRRMGQIVYWKVFTRNHYKGLYIKESIQPITIDWSLIKHSKSLSITWLKHAGILINDLGRYLLIDPVFGGLFGLFKDFTPFGFDASQIPQPHYVLITHGHYDHLDENTLRTFDKNTHIVSPLGYNDIFRKLNMNNRNQLDWFESYTSGKIRITLLPCHHWTMRNPVFGPNRSLWGSYLIETASGQTVYIAGDTGYFDGFSEIGRQYDIDLAIFNLGAYEPRWFMVGSHMNPEETVHAFEMLGAKKFMIVHWGTFRLGDEPVFLLPEDLKEILERKGLTHCWIDIRHGQTIIESHWH